MKRVSYAIFGAGGYALDCGNPQGKNDELCIYQLRSVASHDASYSLSLNQVHSRFLLVV